MKQQPGGSITQLLRAAARGERSAAEDLMEQVHVVLLRIARRKLARVPRGSTLAPEDLVGEAYLRLFGGREKVHWNDRVHFFNTAAQVMSSVRKDWARRKHRLKRGAGERPVPLDDAMAEAVSAEPRMALELLEALDVLEHSLGRRRRAVTECRLAGLTVEETAGVLKSSPATVDRDWRLARATLRRHLTDSTP